MTTATSTFVGSAVFGVIGAIPGSLSFLTLVGLLAFPFWLRKMKVGTDFGLWLGVFIEWPIILMIWGFGAFKVFDLFCGNPTAAVVFGIIGAVVGLLAGSYIFQRQR